MFRALIPVALLGFSVNAEAQPPHHSSAYESVDDAFDLMSDAWFRTPAQAPSAAGDRVSSEAPAARTRGVSRASDDGGRTVDEDEDEEEEEEEAVEGDRRRAPPARSKSGKQGTPADRPARRPSAPASDRPSSSPPASDRTTSPRDRGAARPGADRPSSSPPASDRTTSPRDRGTARPGADRPDTPPASDRTTSPRDRGAARPGADRTPQDRDARPGADRPSSSPPASDRTRSPRDRGAARPGTEKPGADRPNTPRDRDARPGQRPGTEKPGADRPNTPRDRDARPGQRPGTERPGADRPNTPRDRDARPGQRPGTEKPGADRPKGPRDRDARPGQRPGTEKPGADRPKNPRDRGARPGMRPGPGSPGAQRPGAQPGPGGPGARRPNQGPTVGYRNVRPYHGVIVYGPRPDAHNNYTNERGPVEVQQADMPKRSLDRKGSLAVGLRAGNFYSGYVEGDRYTDFGAGIAARYRPAENVGLEIALQHHDETWNSASTRGQTVASASFELFAFAWTRFSPYAIAGLTYTSRNAVEQVRGMELSSKPLIGPHAGLGIELALGKSLAIDLEGRYIGYINRAETELARAGAFTLTGGLMIHF